MACYSLCNRFISRASYAPQIQNFFHLNRVQQRSVADEKTVKLRINSIQSIEKITRAMKMVASSKIRSDLLHREAMHRFARPFADLALNFASSSPSSSPSADPVSVCLSLFSEKGLCGAVNASVARATQLELSHRSSPYHQTLLYTLGEQGQRLETKGHMKRHGCFTQVPRNADGFVVSALVAHRLLEKRNAGRIIIYNHFKNLLAYETKCMHLIDFQTFVKFFLDSGGLLEPEDLETLSNLFEFYVAVSIYRAMIENYASEQSNRISSMDNASKNAADMLTQLKLKYNTARQIKTTMELIEIISGASVLT